MNKDYKDFLKRFIDSRNEDEDRIYACICGGGISIAELGILPGSSKVLYGANVLYHEDATRSYLKRFHQEYNHEHMVSPELSKSLYEAMTNEIGFVSPSMGHPRVNLIAITSAVTTNRYRRGANKAYITFKFGTFELNLDKLPESVHTDSVIPWRDQKLENHRASLDEQIAMVAIRLVTGFEENKLDFTNLRRV